jgi:hypothetical protein
MNEHPLDPKRILLETTRLFAAHWLRLLVGTLVAFVVGVFTLGVGFGALLGDVYLRAHNGRVSGVADTSDQRGRLRRWLAFTGGLLFIVLVTVPMNWLWSPLEIPADAATLLVLPFLAAGDDVATAIRRSLRAFITHPITTMWIGAMGWGFFEALFFLEQWVHIFFLIPIGLVALVFYVCLAEAVAAQLDKPSEPVG